MEFGDIVSAEMPHSTEAEQTVLGAVLMDPEQLSVVMEYLKADSFYKPPRHAGPHKCHRARMEVLQG